MKKPFVTPVIRVQEMDTETDSMAAVSNPKVITSTLDAEEAEGRQSYSAFDDEEDL